MCYVEEMATIGVRELRQRASEVLRSVEAGEPATVTVAGRPVAQIVPLGTDNWTTWDRVKRIFTVDSDLDWAEDRLDLDGEELLDPWER